ncbi:hypothetical protein SAY87_007334 [Trapa incisa]|uniref:HIT domain-containing protein n=1 Tax=Trapa incisa TaxID=236973 RepID=A0AAN7K2P8_9MYRT|nr:hypothetical protein SAY87_007334 [Trapa incisa]
MHLHIQPRKSAMGDFDQEVDRAMGGTLQLLKTGNLGGTFLCHNNPAAISVSQQVLPFIDVPENPLPWLWDVVEGLLQAPVCTNESCAGCRGDDRACALFLCSVDSNLESFLHWVKNMTVRSSMHSDEWDLHE